ncbi:alpha-(1-_3)-arabinofuranosyltransferase domain-containing protein [Actinomadura napierensis]|uniref:Alpha-(1->3)-arabinofuranosyltransferase n=1 Tax=Actinomadura napierensis TaxID=267854 RepID=A0ABP5KXX8_9ACTN
MTATAPLRWTGPASPSADGTGRDPDARMRDRMRLLVSSLLLLTVAFTIAPKRILPDTKLDMALNPGGFLGRALNMWDATSYFGQVQNQAYGYLFPMGPFYLLGKGIGLPPWVTQRLWLGLVLVVALTGLVKLAEEMRIGSPGGRLLAGFAYALAPRAELLLGVNSSEFLPTAMLPWILIPLVRGARTGSTRRAAALSALAIVCCGGINAAAEAAVLVVPLVYLLTRARGPRKWRLLGWWLPCTAAASVWWLVPAYLMGRYIFPFIDYTESATTTTQTTSLANTLRGTSSWTAFLPVDTNPWWPAGHAASTVPWLVAVTGAVAAFGLLGLGRRGLPERGFLVLSLLLGVVLIATGHHGPLAPPFADTLRDLLDTALAPLRNIHKFDALVRLPLVLGLARLVSAVPAGAPWWKRPNAGFAAIAAVALAAVPMLNPGPTANANMPDPVPAYWRQAADWINERGGLNTTMAVPGVPFADFQWGRAMDDPLQALLSVSWADRSAVPYGSAGAARLTRAIDQRLATGQGSEGLTKVLARMGVRFLLVRNDLNRAELDGAWPARVHEALERSPGIVQRAAFGGPVGDPGPADAVGSFDQPYRALEVYEVTDAFPAASTVPADRPLRVIGGPEALLPLADAGLLDGDRPVVFNDDPGADAIPAADTIVTDTLRRREANFSDLRNGESPTLAAGEPYKGTSRVKDILAPGWDDYQAVARYEGIASVTASSSASDITAPSNHDSQSNQPFSALDGDPATQWTSSGWKGALGEWLEVRFSRPIPVDHVTATFGDADFLGPAVTQVAVETEAGSVRDRVAVAGRPQSLPARGGTTSWVRIRVTGLAGPSRTGGRVAIADLNVPGVTARRAIAAPAATGGTTVLTGTDDHADACMRGPVTWTCNPQLARRGESGSFERIFTAAASGARTLGGSAVLTDPKIIAAATTSGPVRVAASSTYVQHPADMARSAFDGDPRTTWIAGRDDAAPRLTIRFGKKTDLSKITVRLPYGQAQKVVLAGDDTTRDGIVDRAGVFRFAPMRTSTLTITFPNAPGVQVTDVTVPGVRPLGAPSQLPLQTKCGTGPSFDLGGRTVRTRLVGGTAADLLDGTPVRYAACGRVPVGQGENRLSVSPVSPYRIVSAVLASGTEGPAASAAAPRIEQWSAHSRSIAVDSSDQPTYLELDENHNDGWVAALGGKQLRSVRLDGWRQAWLVPAGESGTVKLTYAPDRGYRLTLVAGLLLVLLIVVLAIVPARPSTAPPLDPGRVARAVGWAIAALAGFWVGGPAGMVAVPAACALGMLLRRRRDLRPAAIVSAVLAAAVLQGAGTYLDLHGRTLPWRLLTEAAPEVLCLVALGLLISVLGPRPALPDEPDAPAAPAPPPPDRLPDPTGGGLRITWQAAGPPSGPGRRGAAPAPGRGAAGRASPPRSS